MWWPFIFIVFMISGTSGFVNLAHDPLQSLQGQANMSGPAQNSNWTADKAVDGDTNQSYQSNSCAIMDITKQYLTVWWKVRLNRRFNIAYIEIFLRSDTSPRSSGYSIYIYDTDETINLQSPPGNKLIYHHNPISGCPSTIHNITANRLGQEILFFNSRTNGYFSNCADDNRQYADIEICEVKVMGCDSTRYFPECTRSCPVKCKHKNCDAFNGSCIYGCSDPNALTLECNVCRQGTYTSNEHCLPCPSNCKIGTYCNTSTGRCDHGCRDRYAGHFCTECIVGYYGSDCNSLCGHCERPDLGCEQSNGHCLYGCENSHWAVPKCDECSVGYYGTDCNSACEHCNKSSDGCRQSDGHCLHGCENNHWEEPMCSECIVGYYGSDCNSLCGHCERPDLGCEQSKGHCLHGCENSHWAVPNCNECHLGYHGHDCNSVCGHCNKSYPGCRQSDGHCLHGCENNHWEGPMCDKCSVGYYGTDCNTVCEHCNKSSDGCRQSDGHCLHGCENNHWEEPMCSECIVGYYGSNCNSLCGHCERPDLGCEQSNGHCLHGCENSHWAVPNCNECHLGYHGHDCNSVCGHCNKSYPGCRQSDGHCLHGCENNHWEGPMCDKCSVGYYGTDCNTVCEHCNKSSDGCRQSDGHCLHGCENNHWEEPMCSGCIVGHYGSDCNSNCGHCNKTFPGCIQTNGHCLHGCENDHWRAPTCAANVRFVCSHLKDESKRIGDCIDDCSDGYYNNDCNSTCDHCNKSSPGCRQSDGHCLHGCESLYWEDPKCDECTVGYFGNDCNLRCGHCNSTSPACRKSDGHCLYGCDNQWVTPTCEELVSSQKGVDPGSIAGGVASVIIVLGVIIVFSIIYKRRRTSMKRDPGKQETSNAFSLQATPRSKENQYANCEDQSLEELEDEHINEALSGDDGGYYNTAELTANIRIEDLQHVITEKNTGVNKTFVSEYKRLPVGNPAKCKAAQQRENGFKNRFKTTFPYDQSRIILKEKWTNNDNDYINASYVKNHNGQKAYIAAQGPKDITLTDFWRMICQENIKSIVMLTNIMENGKNKCTQYWPEKGKTMNVGPCKIKSLEETVYAFYTCRKFIVHQNNSNKRTITQLHYTAWPDHGTPEELGLVQFHRAVTKKHQTGGLMLVHCSAGVGRTGTFIGLDSLVKQGQETGRINVFEFVKQMREDRMTMVQTADQYIFLHKALLCEFQEKNTVIVENDIPVKFNSLLQDTSPLNQSTLYKEYKLLQTLKPSYDDKDKEDGRKPENRQKNANMNVLPVSRYRPYLTSYIKGRTDYINAVRVHSFTALNALILTQYPLNDTEVDLWRLCMDHDVHAMVILWDNSEEFTWIPKKGLSQSCTPYTLTSGDTGSSISGVSQDSLVISNDERKTELDVFRIPFGNNTAMLKGVDLLLDNEKQNHSATVIISKDGAGPAGVFSVLHNVLQQLRMDKEVDIFTSVRQIQTKRPEVITKLDEYKRCYELVPLSVSEDGIYANV